MMVEAPRHQAMMMMMMIGPFDDDAIYGDWCGIIDNNAYIQKVYGLSTLIST